MMNIQCKKNYNQFENGCSKSIDFKFNRFSFRQFSMLPLQTCTHGTCDIDNILLNTLKVFFTFSFKCLNVIRKGIPSETLHIQQFLYI